MAQEQCFSNNGLQSTNTAAANFVGHKEHVLMKWNGTSENIRNHGRHVLRVIIVLWNISAVYGNIMCVLGCNVKLLTLKRGWQSKVGLKYLPDLSKHTRQVSNQNSSQAWKQKLGSCYLVAQEALGWVGIIMKKHEKGEKRTASNFGCTTI